MINVLQIHLSESKKKLRQHIENYNLITDAQLQQENAARIEAGEKPLTRKARDIKGTHVATAEKILNAFYNHLKELAKLKVDVASPEPFKMNNVAIARMGGHKISHNKKTNANYSNTSQRHLAVLERAGVLKKGTWHGTNSGFELEINPTLLCTYANFDFNTALLNTACKLLKTDQLPEPVYKTLFCLTPSFSDFPTGIINTSCAYIVTRTLQEHNINMIEGIASDKFYNAAEKTSSDYYCQDQQSINERKILTPNNENESSDKQSGGAAAPQSTQKKNATGDALKTWLYYVDMSWEFAHSVLYDKKYFSESDITAAKQFIKYFYSKTVERGNMNFKNLYHQFTERCFLARRYRIKEIYRFIPNPITYFDPHFDKGFGGTFAWYEKSKELKKTNKEWNQHAKLIADLFHEFKQAPSVPIFLKHKQRLEKLKDKRPLHLYLTFVTEPEKYNHETLTTKVA